MQKKLITWKARYNLNGVESAVKLQPTNPQFHLIKLCYLLVSDNLQFPYNGKARHKVNGAESVAL